MILVHIFFRLVSASYMFKLTLLLYSSPVH